MVQEILIAVVPTIASAGVGVSVAIMNRHNKIRAKFRTQENDVLYDSIEAVGELAELTATCYKSGGIMNGNLDKAIEKRKAAKEARVKYLKEVNNAMKNW